MAAISKQTTVGHIVLNAFTHDSRVLKTCRSLVQNGFDVKVLALHRDSLPRSETIDGIEVCRVRLRSISLPKTMPFQLIKYFEFCLRVLVQYNNRDIYHCNDLGTLPVGIMLKLFSRRKVKVIYDAHEYEIEQNGLSKIQKKMRYLLERSLIRFSDKTITVSDSIAGEYVRLYGIEKPVLVLNTPQLSNPQGRDLLRESLGIEADKTIFLYQGGLSRGRGIEVLLDAFEQMNDPRKVIVFLGYGPLEDEIIARARRCPTIYFHPAVPPDQVSFYTDSADVGISTIENSCRSYYYCLPNKLFEYAMAEIPVIVSNLYEMKTLVDQYYLGVVANENTVSGIVQAVTEMKNFDRERFKKGIQDFKRRFNWQVQEERLLHVYTELASA